MKKSIYIGLRDFHDILRIASTIDKNPKRSFMTFNVWSLTLKYCKAIPIKNLSLHYSLQPYLKLNNSNVLILKRQ